MNTSADVESNPYAIVIDGYVYDLKKFISLHPGGASILRDSLLKKNKDLTDEFHAYHDGAAVMRKYHDKLCIGKLENTKDNNNIKSNIIKGPYSEPLSFSRFNSPYYKPSHISWKKHVNEFVDREMRPTMHLWIHKDMPPVDILKKMGEAGLLAAMCGPPYPVQYAPKSAYVPEDFDYFHEMILFDELAKLGSGSAVAAVSNGAAIALSAVLKFGSKEMKQKVAPAVLAGEKFIALAISEPQAGSDIGGLVTTAVRSDDNTHFIINGAKKFITNGTYSDYFVTAVVTDMKEKNKQKALSFILIDKSECDKKGSLDVRKLHIRGSSISGSAYLSFDNLKVPISNLIGKENKGFKLIMYNFNHERFYIVAIVVRMCRVCLEESINYAIKRKTFNKALYKHQTIRMKIAAMIRQVEQLQAWLEFLTYQMCTMSHQEANLKLGDMMCAIKSQASRTYEEIARETTNVFGGNSLLLHGPGQKIERAVAQVKAYQIPAGAEDIMDDFLARSAFRMAKSML